MNDLNRTNQQTTKNNDKLQKQFFGKKIKCIENLQPSGELFYRFSYIFFLEFGYNLCKHQ